jgi:hypothetical protein
LVLALALMSDNSQAANTDRDVKAGVAGAPQSALISSSHASPRSDPRSALAAIRAEWTECRNRAFGQVPLQECDDQAIDRSDALLRLSRVHRRLRNLEADLFELLVNVSAARGEDVVATQVSVIYSDADLAQRRAAILTGASRTPLVHERVPYSVANLLRRLDGTMDAQHRRLLAPGGAQSWLRQWHGIRNQDCTAYPVQQCAALLDGAFRGMLYDNLTDGGRTGLPPLRQ